MMLPCFLQVGLSLLLWLQLFPRVLAEKGSSGCNTFLCVNATLHDDDTITYELTNLYQPLGWLAIGWGRKMDHTQMVVMWPNDEDGSIILSNRFGWGHEMPSNLMNPRREPVLVEPVPTPWSPGPNSTRMAFKIPANKTALAQSPIENLIWAYGMNRPGNRPWSTLLPHYRAGFLRINFSKDAIPPPPPGSQPMNPPSPSGSDMSEHNHHPDTGDSTVFESENHSDVFSDKDVPWGNHEKLITAHGTLLAIGFLVLLPSGSLIARWTRTITPKWFKAHSFINMTIALPVIVIGWLMGPMAVISHDAPHLVTTHQLCGVFLLALYLLQVWLGRYIHRRRAEGLVPNNKPHPPSNVLHVCLGISVIAFAFFQTGFDEWETATGRGTLHSWCHDLWLAWSIIVPFAYLAGLSLVPRQFYQERQYIMPGGNINYVVLPDGADSPLLDETQDHDVSAVYDESNGRFRNTRLSMETVKVEAEK
ncbi:hypothetical protein AN958_02384 [Leucoagaricus sp. SymC.cos]|nr:hypothetical protein AN958_02384 [Leucoagaricus sp. SymC.cos]